MKERAFLELLTKKLAGLAPGTPLYRTLKAELTRAGYWKNRTRGIPRELPNGQMLKKYEQAEDF